MSYKIEIKAASKNGWQTPAEAKKYYGRYSRDGITAHWWNDPKLIKDSDHNNIVKYVQNQAQAGNMSINYVLSNTKITQLVAPENVAWHATSGNPTTIGIEFSPHLNAEGYKKAGWLIWQLEKRFNKKLAIYPHKYWNQTACPGTISLTRLRDEANKWARGDYNPKPVTSVVKASLTWSKLSKPVEYVANKPVTNLWNFDSTAWNMKSVKQFKKGDRITIYGKVVNNTLKATYLLTEYSYTNKITNGFNEVDLDKYVAPPAPTPKPVTPPEDVLQPVDPPKTEPAVPKEASDFEARLTALEKVVQAIVDFLSSVFKNFTKG